MHYSGAVYRPPSEANSLIVQCTLGCSHNKCAFCIMYKAKQFSIDSLEQVLGDLAEVAGHRIGLVGIALVDWEARLRLSKELRVVVEMLAEERGARILGSPVRHATFRRIRQGFPY